MRRCDPALTSTGPATNEKLTATGNILACILDRPSDIPAQLRRRRAASYRLPALEDGRRDPWSRPWPLASLESRRATWTHLHSLGLLDENTDAILRGVA